MILMILKNTLTIDNKINQIENDLKVKKYLESLKPNGNNGFIKSSKFIFLIQVGMIMGGKAFKDSNGNNL